MNKIAPYLLAPTGLWVFWIVVYLNYVIGQGRGEWWGFPFFMTLFITEIIAICITAISIIVIRNRYKKSED